MVYCERNMDEFLSNLSQIKGYELSIESNVLTDKHFPTEGSKCLNPKHFLS